MDREMELLFKKVDDYRYFPDWCNRDRGMLLKILKLQAEMIDDLQKRVDILERNKP